MDHHIERAVLIVKPKQPYLDWIRRIDGVAVETMLEELRRDCTAYLIPVVETDEDGRRIVERYHAELFEEELEAWSTDRSTWPHRRELPTFLEWFDAEIHSVVIDLGG